MPSSYFKASTLLCTLATIKAFAWDSPCCELTDEYYGPSLDCCDTVPDCSEPDVYYEWNTYTDISFAAGYRQDRLTWSIADLSGSQNILSKLQWNDLQIWEIKGQFDILLCDRIFMRGYADYGKIYQGHNKDSDYSSDHKELSRSKAKAKGEVFDISGGIGYRFHLIDWFPLCNADWTFTPLFGYSYHAQHLQDHDRSQQINSGLSDQMDEISHGSLGPFPGLPSKYRARWRGPWVGFDTSYPLCCDWKVFGSFEYHWAHYHGAGHWNLGKDFIKDFKQSSKNGHGYVIDIGTRYAFWRAGSFGLTFKYQSMRSDSEKHFNGAIWHTWSILADLEWTFG